MRVLLRKNGDCRGVEGLDVERAYGDLADEASLRDVVRGCQRLYHCAALVSLRNIDREALFHVNVLGTRHLLRTALREGVERVLGDPEFS